MLSLLAFAAMAHAPHPKVRQERNTPAFCMAAMQRNEDQLYLYVFTLPVVGSGNKATGRGIEHLFELWTPANLNYTPGKVYSVDLSGFTMKF